MVSVDTVSSDGENCSNLPYDIDKLAIAISFAETGNCKHAINNNCFGIMTWERGYREQKKYNNTEESFEDFKRIWSTYYKRYPDMALAIKWTGNDRADTWIKNVNYHYNNK